MLRVLASFKCRLRFVSCDVDLGTDTNSRLTTLRVDCKQLDVFRVT
jgi:hypothetical protein